MMQLHFIHFTVLMCLQLIMAKRNQSELYKLNLTSTYKLCQTFQQPPGVCDCPASLLPLPLPQVRDSLCGLPALLCPL